MLQHGISLLKWDPSGYLLATCANEPHLKLWTTSSGGGIVCKHHIDHTPDAVVTMEWCSMIGRASDPKLMLASGTADGAVFVWTVPLPAKTDVDDRAPDIDDTPRDVIPATHSLVQTLRGHRAAITAIAFSPSALTLASGCAKGCLNIWSLQVCNGEHSK